MTAQPVWRAYVPGLDLICLRDHCGSEDFWFTGIWGFRTSFRHGALLPRTVDLSLGAGSPPEFCALSPRPDVLELSMGPVGGCPPLHDRFAGVL